MILIVEITVNEKTFVVGERLSLPDEYLSLSDHIFIERNLLKPRIGEHVRLDLALVQRYSEIIKIVDIPGEIRQLRFKEFNSCLNCEVMVIYALIRVIPVADEHRFLTFFLRNVLYDSPAVDAVE